MSKSIRENDRVAAVRAVWEEGFFYIARTLNKFLDENDVPKVVADPGKGEPKATRLTHFRRHGKKRKISEDSSINRSLPAIRQRFLNAFVSIRQFVSDSVSDAEMKPWSIGFANSREHKLTMIYGRGDELEPFFLSILKSRPIGCWHKDIIVGILEHQSGMDCWFDGLNELLSRPREANPNDARDEWIYEECCKLVSYTTIIIWLKGKPKSWEPINSPQGIKAAANRYAKRHGLDPIPKRYPGRRKTK